MTKRIKCVLVGDGAVGKTCLFAVWINKKFPEGYVPTVMDNYAVMIEVKKQPVHLEVWDTAGQEDFQQIRQLSYPNTDVFVICYSTNSIGSFKNVWDFWLKEIQEMQTPFILCGTKSDLCDEDSPGHVPESLALEFAKTNKAWNSIRCSAKNGTGDHAVTKVFHNVIKCGLGERSPILKKKGGCECVLM